MNRSECQNQYNTNQNTNYNNSTEDCTLLDKFSMILTKNNGNSIAMRWEKNNSGDDKPLDKWEKYTWSEYYQKCNSFSKALINLNFQLNESVCIQGYNSPEWLIAFMGSIMCGGQACGIYPTDSLEQIKYKIEDSNCTVLVVENNKKCYLDLLSEETLALRQIIIIDCREKTINHDKVIYFDDFINSVTTVNINIEINLENRRKNIKPTDTACFVYTSGTTGNPKAVIISHDNLIFQAESVLKLTPNCKNIYEEERIISYLPLSHVAGMMVDVICPIIGASQSNIINLNFSRPTDLKNGTIKNRLQIVKPTLFLGVPRVWEKFMDAINKKISENKPRKQNIINWARKVCLNNKFFLSNVPIISRILKKIAIFIVNKIKSGLGLNECKYFFSGAAPLAPSVTTFFKSININVAEVYGMSECTGATTFSTIEQIKIGCCGRPLPGTEIKVINDHNQNCIVDNIDSPPEELQGEICFRGRHIMSGYYCKETSGEKYENIIAKNKETIDSDGWLHSGDKGTIDNLGNVKITGRYKEIIIGAGGENISPVPIENKLKQICPIINQVVMIGDKKKYNIALITLKLTNYGDDIVSCDDALVSTDLTQNKLLKDVCNNSEIINHISQKIEEVNNDGTVILNNSFKIQKFCILSNNFSIDGGEFTATLKIKRSFIENKYGKTIDNIYNFEGKCFKI